MNVTSQTNGKDLDRVLVITILSDIFSYCIRIRILQIYFSSIILLLFQGLPEKHSIFLENDRQPQELH